MKDMAIICLALLAAVTSSANVFLPSSNGEVWSEPSNWSESVVPNASGTQVEIGVPTKFKKNKGWRNIHVDIPVTVGTVTMTCGGCTNRLDTGDTGGDLTFDGGEGSAQFSVSDETGAGLAMIDLDSPYAVRLSTDVTFTVANEEGDAEYGGILLKGLLAGNGHCLKKSGAGVMTLDMTNAEGADPLDKLQIEAGTVSILRPLTVGAITKEGVCRVLMSAKSSAEALASSVVCTSKMSVDNPCLFIPTSAGNETYYGGFVSPDLKKASKCKAYVLSDAGEVLFDGRCWTPCDEVELSSVDLADGMKTYKAVVPPLGGDTPEISAKVEFKTTAPVLGKVIETTISGALTAPSYRWMSWPCCGDAAAAEEVGTGSAYAPTEDDLEHWLQVQVWQDSKLVCSNTLYFSRLPVVYLTTDDGLPVISKEEYVSASLTIQGNDEFKQQYAGVTEVKGRGNSSWALYPQKSYKLKLGKKTDLFGFGKNKHWVLISCFKDRAFLRNKAASDLAKSLGIIGMDMTWVDVVYNGDYYGVYMLGEHLRVGENRVDIFNWDDEAESVAEELFEQIKDGASLTSDDLSALETQMDEDFSWMSTGKVFFKDVTYNLADYGLWKLYDFSGGYIFEVDIKKDGISRYETKGGLNIHVDTPEFLSSNSEMVNTFTSLWERFETAYKSPSGRGEDGIHYTQIANLDSMVAFWLVNELMGQEDPTNSRFSHIEQGGKLIYGPVWDFDTSSAAGGLSKHGKFFSTLSYDGKDGWFRYWVQHQDFRSRAIEFYWQVARSAMVDFVNSCAFDELTAYFAEAGDAEDMRWGKYPNAYNPELPMPTHAEDVENWRSYILDHIAWLDVQLSSERSFAQCLKNIYPESPCVAYDLAGGTCSSALRTIIEPNAWFNLSRPKRPGYVFAGWSLSGEVSPSARYSVALNESRPLSPITLCGADSSYCSFKNLSEPGCVVCLRANWVLPGGYAVEYDLGGGRSGDAYPISVGADEWLEVPAPVRDGYEFAGWSLEGAVSPSACYAVPGSTEVYEVSGAFAYGGGFASCRFFGLATAGGFVRLKAHWSIAGGYAVEYDLNGGQAGAAYQDSIGCSAWLYLKTPVREGYEFAGWSLIGDIFASGRYSTQSGVAQLLDPEAVSYGGGHDYCSFYGLTGECGAVLLRANWALPDGYAVEYDLNGGVATGTYKTSVVADKWLTLSAPTREGYEFAGWTVEGEMLPTARYSVQSPTSYRISGVSSPVGSGSERCQFWNLAAVGGVVRLTAHWIVPGGYAVEYDLGGGRSGDAYPISVGADEWLEVPAPVRDGYEFAGWSLEGAVSPSACYAVSGSEIFELSGAFAYGGGYASCRFFGLAAAGGFVRLKAHWSIAGGYAVEYDLNGGQADATYQDSIGCSAWLYLKTPVREGYEFAGWSLIGDVFASGRYSTQSGVAQLLDPAAVSYGGGHDFCQFYGLTGECGAVLLRANWALPDGYAVEYDLNGGVATGTYKTSVVADKWLTLSAPTREGYEFAGWTVEGEMLPTARHSVQSPTSYRISGVSSPVGGGFERCQFWNLAAVGGAVRLTAHWVESEGTAGE